MRIGNPMTALPLLLAVGVAAGASVQAAERGIGGDKSTVFFTFDANNDGVITRDELPSGGDDRCSS